MSQNRVPHQAGTDQVLLGDVIHWKLNTDHDGGSLCRWDDALKRTIQRLSPLENPV